MRHDLGGPNPPEPGSVFVGVSYVALVWLSLVLPAAALLILALSLWRGTRR